MKNIIFAILASLLLASAVFAQGSVEGTITDAKGAVVDRAVVSLVDAKGTTVAQSTTDAEGYYTLDDIAAGTYKLVVNAGGFKLATKTNVLVVDDGLTVIDLKLTANAVVTANPWPQPKFRFEVEYTVNGKTSRFNVQDVAGLDVNEPEYRAENKAKNAPPNVPGWFGRGDITLKKGVFTGDNAFFEWYRQIADAMADGKRPVRGTVVINLLDEKGSPTMSWTLTNAFPKKIQGVNQATGSVETIIITHEGLTIAK